MSVPNQDARQEIRLYIDHAHEMLEVAALTLAEGYQGSTINRAYYAIFYATNALLATQGFSRSKHSGVISAFREHFVRPGLIEAEYSRIYGRIMDNRRVSDYEIELAVDVRAAEMDLSELSVSLNASKSICDRKTGFERTINRASDTKRA